MFYLCHDKDFGLMGRPDSPKPYFEAYESPDRAWTIWNYLKQQQIPSRKDVHKISPLLLTERDILRVHSPYLLKIVQNLTLHGKGEIGNTVLANEDTYPLAVKSAGAVVQLAKIAATNKVHNEPAASPFGGGFAINRPPGHHASTHVSDGLCVFNNIAIAITYLREVLDFHEPIAIIDIDEHFGNGLSNIFYEDPSVLYCSVHEGVLQLGEQGAYNEIGALDGLGTNINFQVPVGTFGPQWLISLSVFEPILRQFQPSLIFVAAGLDGHWADPLGNLSLCSSHYHTFARWLKSLSSDICDSRVIYALEGGYNLLMLGRLVETLIAPFLDDYSLPPALDEPCPHENNAGLNLYFLRQVQRMKKELCEILSPYWDFPNIGGRNPPKLDKEG